MSHRKVADYGDAHRTSPLVDDVEDLDNHADLTIEHFAEFERQSSPNYVDGVGVSDDEWDSYGEDLLNGEYEQWFLEVGQNHFDNHSQASFDMWAEAEGMLLQPQGLDAARRWFHERYSAKRTASSPTPRSASGGIHCVAGWDWDNRQSAYIAQSGVSEFDCICGRKIATPSFKTCECGKLWNSHTIQTTSGTRIMCREVPRRDALLASR